MSRSKEVGNQSITFSEFQELYPELGEKEYEAAKPLLPGGDYGEEMEEYINMMVVKQQKEEK